MAECYKITPQAMTEGGAPAPVGAGTITLIKYSNLKSLGAEEDGSEGEESEEEALLPSSATLIPTVSTADGCCFYYLTCCRLCTGVSSCLCHSGGSVCGRREGTAEEDEGSEGGRSEEEEALPPSSALLIPTTFSAAAAADVCVCVCVTVCVPQRCRHPRARPSTHTHTHTHTQVPVEVSVWSLGSYRLKGVAELMEIIQVIPTALEMRISYQQQRGALNKVCEYHVRVGTPSADCVIIIIWSFIELRSVCV